MSDYKRNPRGARRARKSMGRKAIVVLSLMMVLVLAAVGGTVAWLTDNSGPVTNTFTVGDIGINLTETPDQTYHIVPGVNIAKDPKVTVTANSEKCYVFVKVDEANWPNVMKADNTGRKVDYSMASGWNKLEGVEGVDNVWYREVETSTTAQEFPVLADNTVTVSGELTKAEANAITSNPTLTFTAYAVQYANSATTHFTPAEAWAKVAD